MQNQIQIAIPVGENQQGQTNENELIEPPGNQVSVNPPVSIIDLSLMAQQKNLYQLQPMVMNGENDDDAFKSIKISQSANTHLRSIKSRKLLTTSLASIL